MTPFVLAVKNLSDFNITINKLIEQRNELLTSIREECLHLKIAEVDYSPSTHFFHAQPPKRICEVCGVEEEGWRCGYIVLAQKEGRVFRTISSREEFFNLRQPGPIREVGNSLIK